MPENQLLKSQKIDKTDQFDLTILAMHQFSIVSSN